MHSLEKLEQETQHVGVRVVTSRVIEHVKAMPGALRSAESMPNFASSPLEYVTQIGQYLMTLPQYLDISQHLPSDDEHSVRLYRDAIRSISLTVIFPQAIKNQTQSDIHL